MPTAKKADLAGAIRHRRHRPMSRGIRVTKQSLRRVIHVLTKRGGLR